MTYVRWQFKTAADQYLYMDWTGVASGGRQEADDDYSKWLLISTGEPNEYWIFNKGAQSGSAQALTLPSSKNLFGQWDFLGEDAPDKDRQKFIIRWDFSTVP